MKRYLCPVCGAQYDPHAFKEVSVAELNTPSHCFLIGSELRQLCQGSQKPPRVEHETLPEWLNKKGD